jgi:alkylation response protein AidB-like acyl-CoA dehydrogenase
MHLFQVGTSADGYRNGNEAMGGILRRVANEGIVIASNGAESIVAGEWTTPTTAVRQNGHYVINGRKYFCSQSTGADVIRLIARDVETDELLVVPVTRATPGVSVVETWDTMGMRASASHDIALEDVQVPVEAVGVRIPPGAPLRNPAIANIGRWFLSLVSGVYLGIAEEAREAAYASLGGGINSNDRDPALTHMLIGEMEAAWMTARSTRDQVVSELEPFPSDMQAALAQAILCKEVVTTQAQIVVDKAVQIAGGRSYYKKSPLERLVRDMRAARYHPPAAPISFQMAGERVREGRLAKAL